MDKYTCSICQKPITNYDEALFVKITNEQNKIVEVAFVHKGECDNQLVRENSARGLNTNASMELSSFSSDEEREEYYNNAYF